MIAVGIFAKPPVPGLVKTRLAAEIGNEKAARVYRHCLNHTLRVAHLSGLDYQVYLSQVSDEQPFEDGHYRLQKGTDLGMRMVNAMGDLISAGNSAAIIIGSDCLDIDAGHLQRAAQALSDHELVLTPAMDGGFALVGCSEPVAGLFESVAWSSQQALEQTLSNARRLDYRIALLDPVRDIDTLQDLEHYPQLVALIASG